MLLDPVFIRGGPLLFCSYYITVNLAPCSILLHPVSDLQYADIIQL